MAAPQKGALRKRAWIVFFDESGSRCCLRCAAPTHLAAAPPTLLHRLNWKKASMAAALGYHGTDPERGARLCFHLKPGSYDTDALISVREQLKAFYEGERVVLVWDGSSAHRSRTMRAWVDAQDRLILERLPAYAPELNPVEMLWSAIKTRELANVAGEHLADATERGIDRVCADGRHPWSLLAHSGLEIHPFTPHN